jgi:hypothetical protein
MRLFHFFRHKNSLRKKVVIIEEEMKKNLLISLNEKFNILHYGAYEIDPKHLVFWICVDTDEIKEQLQKDKKLNNNLRNVLVKNEYPKEAIDEVYIGFESQETVDRESKGDWYLHFK